MKRIELEITKEELRKQLEIKDGKDGISPSIDEVVAKVLPKIPKPKDGKGGKNGVDGKSGKTGPKGDRGPQGGKGNDGKDGKPGSPDTPEDIKKKLLALKGTNRLPVSAIHGAKKMVSDFLEKTQGPGTVYGNDTLTIQNNGTDIIPYSSNLNFINGTNTTVVVTKTTDGKATIKVNATGGGGTAAPTDRYINPSTGSDSNNGQTSTAAYATFAPLNTELAVVNNGIKRVLIDTSAGLPLYVASADYLRIKSTSPGLEVCSANQARAKIYGAVPVIGANWTKTGGQTNVYQTTNTIAGSVIWEDNKWLTRVSSATAPLATIDSTAGSFWTDNTTMYYHAFGDTDPRSDTKTRFRSTVMWAPIVVGDDIDGTNTNPATPDVYIHDLEIDYTASLQNNADLPQLNKNGYGVWGGNAGVARYANMKVSRFGYHAFGWTSDHTDAVVHLEDCLALQANPYYNGIHYVNFSAEIGAGNRVYVYERCSDGGLTGEGQGVIGTATGTRAYQPWLCHNLGDSTKQFKSITWKDCDFGGIMLQANDMITDGMIFKGCTLGYVWPIYGRFYNCNFKVMPDAQSLTGTVEIYNSTLKVETGTVFFQGGLMKGTYKISNTVFDLRNYDYNVILENRLLERNGALTLTFVGNSLLQPRTSGDPHLWMFANIMATDTVLAGGNYYSFRDDAYQNICYQYNATTNKSMKDWVGLGFDIPNRDQAWFTPTGTVDGSNTVFTPAFTPSLVVSDGNVYAPGFGYTFSGGNITLTIATQDYIIYQ